MKKYRLFILSFLFFIQHIQYVPAQIIQLVPNPQPVGLGVKIFNNNFGNRNTIVYNNKLYIQYATSTGIFQMAAYDGTTLTLIPNPDAGPGYGSPGDAYPIIYNNNLYFEYTSLKGRQLGKLVDNTIKLIPNPDGGLGFLKTFPIEYNNKLIIQYANASNNGQLAEYDGTSVTLIPAPDSLTGFPGYPPIIVNNKLYFEISNSIHGTQFAWYDGTKITIIPNPDASAIGFGRNPILFNNKIYSQYKNAAGIFQIAQIDGSTVTLIANPDRGVGSGYTGNFNYAVYNNKLYIQDYQDSSQQVFHMAVFDGNTISLIPNVLNGQAYEFDFPAIVFNNKLYFEYLDSLNIPHLGEYDGNKIVIIPNPDAGNTVTFFNPPIIYNDKLYIGYFDATGYLKLSVFDGTSVSLIPNPDKGNFDAGLITYNNKIYFDYSTSSGTNQLGYLSNCNTVTTKISIVYDAIDSICRGTRVTFTATPTNGGSTPTFQWFKNGIHVGTNDNLYTDLNLKNKDSIFCKLTSNAGCVSTPSATSNTIIMNVLDSINPSVNIASSTNNVCFGTPVTFIANPANEGNTPLYKWMVNGDKVGNTTATFISNTLKNNDVINCELTSSLGCTASVVSDNNIFMSVYPLPVVTNGTDRLIQLGTTIQLNLPIAGDIASYMWSPPNGLNNTSIKSPYANPIANTTYELMVTSNNGCIASGKIKVNVFSELLMPNAFTPNGDGNNDLFRIPPSISIKINSFTILNRWGNKIFNTNDPTKSWDGTYDSEPQPEGVYIWMLTYTDPLKNEVKQVKGTVTLIR